MKCEIRYAFGQPGQNCEVLTLAPLAPVLTIWPTYDGYCKDDQEEVGGAQLSDEVDAAWSRIVSSSLEETVTQMSLNVIHLEYYQPSKLFFWQEPRPQRWRQAQQAHQKIDVNSLALREHSCHDALLHLLSRRPLPEQSPRGPNLSALREDLTAVLNFGIEEAVMHSWWDEPQRFLHKLAQRAKKHGHILVESRSFISHWVTTGIAPVDYSASGGSPTA